MDVAEIELHQLDQRYAALRRRDARRERALLASLSEIGQQAPVVVVRDAGERWVLVDGYKRVRALVKLNVFPATEVALFTTLTPACGNRPALRTLC